MAGLSLFQIASMVCRVDDEKNSRLEQMCTMAGAEAAAHSILQERSRTIGYDAPVAERPLPPAPGPCKALGRCA